MGFKEVLQRMKEKRQMRNAMLKQAQEQDRVERLIEERKKSANERELERFQNTQREEQIKEQLEDLRKREKEDINFGHNPLNTPNVIREDGFSVLKQKNIFTHRSNLFGNDNLFFK